MTDFTIELFEEAINEISEQRKEPSSHPIFPVSLENKEKLDSVFKSPYIRSHYIAIPDIPDCEEREGIGND